MGISERSVIRAPADYSLKAFHIGYAGQLVLILLNSFGIGLEIREEWRHMNSDLPSETL
jgi:hypothetical protein